MHGQSSNAATNGLIDSDTRGCCYGLALTTALWMVQTDSAHDSAHGLFALQQIGLKFKLEPLSGSKSLEVGASFKVHVASDSIDWAFSLTIHDPVNAVREITRKISALVTLPVCLCKTAHLHQGILEESRSFGVW